MSTKRSNKTARVLNLIASPNEATPVEQSTPLAAPAEKPAAQEEKPKEKARPKTTKPKKASKAVADKAVVETPESASPDTADSSAVSEAPASEQPQPQTTPSPTPQPVVPIVQTVREKEQQVSDNIMAGLLQALNETESPAQVSESPAAEDPQTPVAQTDTDEPEAVKMTTTEPETVQVPPEVPQSSSPQPEEESLTAVQPEPEQTPENVPQVKTPSEEIYTPTGEQDVEYTNVLQELVEETSLYYIANMLQCRCQRCIADMKALALTNLPSKYVVLENSKRAAYMSVYAARYEKDLSVQMMRACVIVNEHPHH